MADTAPPVASCDELSLPGDFESPRSKLVSLTLAASGGTRISQLRSTLGKSQLTIRPIVPELQDADLLERRADDSLQIAETPTLATAGH